MEYRQHASMNVLSSSDYVKHISAMTKEELHSKAEIAEELAVRDMRIKELESQLAAMTQERDEWKRQSSNNWNSAVQNGLLLAASQAREQQLREALETCKNEMPGDKWDSLYIDGVLALPQDDTALRQIVREELARMTPNV